MTQEELARKSTVSVRMIRAYEDGTRDISKAEVRTVYKLSRALCCQMIELFDGETIWNERNK